MNSTPTLTWEDAQHRAKLISRVRRFFENKSVIEVETPLLCHSTVTDVHLDPFETSFNYSTNTSFNNKQTMFLQTSPEFCMKRLLASGYQSIFQICKAFRNEGQGRYHNPEFTMLEWYQIGYTQHQLMNEVSELLSDILKCTVSDFITYQNVFIKFTGIDPLKTSKVELLEYIKINGKMSEWLLSENNIDTLLQFILSEFIEDNIGKTTPCFIYNFPVSQASLAKVSEYDSNTAQRFECYYKGVELVNGFCELTDPVEQMDRFNADNELRERLKLDKRSIDTKFINALESGIPDCSGVAMGIDRLLMLSLGKNDIEDVITFCVDRA